ncbi:MAG: hypothetical protein J7497_16055, partial [Chitinophagaceae bacterium]|nr:hypothetical protein [Chitinophagaceae bacterium]
MILLILLFSGIYSPSTIHQIKAPVGTGRLPLPANSFGEWLRTIQLKRDNTVYLYNGQKKLNQSAQFAVLNISVGNKDLQQCADAIIRLRAEYLLTKGRGDEIQFHTTNGT